MNPACEMLTQDERKGLIEHVQGEQDQEASRHGGMYSSTWSIPTASLKMKRDLSDRSEGEHGHADVSEAAGIKNFGLVQLLSEQAKLSAEQMVNEGIAGVGICKEGSTTCRGRPDGTCKLGTSECRPYTKKELSEMRMEWTEQMKDLVNTGHCRRGYERQCRETGFCEVVLDWNTGVFNPGCRMLTRHERAELYEEIQEQLQAASEAQASPNSAGPKVKRDMYSNEGSRGSGGSSSKSSGGSHGETDYTTTTFYPADEDRPSFKPTQDEVDEFMELCEELSKDPAALETIAEAAGIENPRQIEMLREHYEYLSTNPELAITALEHAKEAQMLSESKLSTMDGSTRETVSRADDDTGAKTKADNSDHSDAAGNRDPAVEPNADDGSKSSEKASKTQEGSNDEPLENYPYGRPSGGGDNVWDPSTGRGVVHR